MFMFPLKNLACKGLTFLTLPHDDSNQMCYVLGRETLAIKNWGTEA